VAEGALEGVGDGFSNEDDEGRLWVVGDRISIADIVVADLVSPEEGGRGALHAGLAPSGPQHDAVAQLRGEGGDT
jgi:glutathione S-transferase